MNTYYAECTVNFTDNSDEIPWENSEVYSFIITASNVKNGRQMAEKLAIKELDRDLGKMDDANVVITTFYKTFSDARC